MRRVFNWLLNISWYLWRINETKVYTCGTEVLDDPVFQDFRIREKLSGKEQVNYNSLQSIIHLLATGVTNIPPLSFPSVWDKATQQHHTLLLQPADLPCRAGGHVGLEGGEGKGPCVGRGKQKIIMRNCGKKAFSINTDNSLSVHLWIHIWAIQTNPSQSQSKTSLFKLGWSRESNNFSLHSFQDSNIYVWEQYYRFK